MAAAKRNDDYIIELTDKAIHEIVYSKYKLLKAYNYYNGKRDPELFRYLEENFGIGNPTSVEFTPLIKKHIDALVGEYLDVPTIPKVSCKDKDTISFINRDKLKEIADNLHEYYKLQIGDFLSDSGSKPVKDTLVEKQIQKIIDEVDNTFLSEYEKAALNVLEYIMQSRLTDLGTRKRQLILDMLISGEAFYRVKPSKKNNNIVIEVLSPLNTFIDRNPESQYVHDSYRAVIRKWKTKQQILSEYGEYLDQDSKKELEETYQYYEGENYMYIRAAEGVHNNGILEGDLSGLDYGKGVVPGYPNDSFVYYNYRLIPVYEVQWIDVDKENGEYVENLYEGIRIGLSIYIPVGKSETVVRTLDDPQHCRLSVGGIFMMNRDNQPMSLVLQCANLLDKYDVVMYLRDNLLANSGTTGDWLDTSMLPSFLGTDMTERIQKWIAYKKSGIALVDSSQEGRGFNNNTFMSGFDDAARLQTIQAFDLVLMRIEELASSITGVFRERLNGITLKDAVTNIEVGAKNSFTITKPFYSLMDTLIVDLLIDCINMAKIVWKNGLTGSLILGDKLLKIFTALPEHFTFTDYDIHIVASTLILKDLLLMQAFVVEMIKAGVMEPDMATEAMTCKSMTELKEKMTIAWNKKKEENNQIKLLEELLLQALLEMQQMAEQSKQLQLKVDLLNEASMELEKEKLKADTQIRWYMAQTDRDYKTSKAETDKLKVEVEYELMYDGNPYNNAVNFNK